MILHLTLFIGLRHDAHGPKRRAPTVELVTKSGHGARKQATTAQWEKPQRGSSPHCGIPGITKKLGAQIAPVFLQ